MAADYLRLCDKDTPEAEYFKKKGITPAKAPQGFFVYNYGSTGIFRRNDWMVTLKGYTTDVWGAEIYKKTTGTDVTKVMVPSKSWDIPRA